MSPSDTVIRLAGPEDFKPLMTGLAGLARDLRDPFEATTDGVMTALFGRERYAFALLALQGDTVKGVALCNPIYSTVAGRTTIYVSDLWVAEAARGQSLGRRLLQAAMTEGRRRWQAGSLRLLVYAENEGAQAFYRRLGFDLRPQDLTAVLSGAALDDFMGDAA
jgi:ribosomal protein S18 acetylase RimI-like enzyme